MVGELIGTRIRERRKAFKLSQRQLAMDAGISAAYLNLIEHNKRGIAGKVLRDIATQLDVPVDELEKGADSPLVDALREAASLAPNEAAEVPRLEELLGRFPGWAGVLGALVHQTKAQSQNITALSDRMTHDPFLGDALHLILSNITAIRSTASILAGEDGIPETTQARFKHNLHRESLRLSQTAEDLVAFLDAGATQTMGEPSSKLDQFFQENRYSISVLENGGSVDDLMEDLKPFASDIEEGEVHRTLKAYERLVGWLPLEPFIDVARSHKFDPLALANHANQTPHRIFARLAHMPPRDDLPKFGLIRCDSSGGVIFRKELQGLSLPQFGAACPLWPLYRAISQPGQPIRAMVETPNADRFLAIAHAQPIGPSSYAMAPPMRSAMLFVSEQDARKFEIQTPAGDPIRIGPHCRVCPRKRCTVRRDPYVLI